MKALALLLLAAGSLAAADGPRLVPPDDCKQLVFDPRVIGKVVVIRDGARRHRPRGRG